MYRVSRGVRSCGLAVCVCVLLLAVLPAVSDAAERPAAVPGAPAAAAPAPGRGVPAPAAPAEKTFKAAVKPFKIEVGLAGIFEAEKMEAISLTPKAWGKIQIVSVAEAGTRVKKGDVIAEMYTKDLDDQIKEIEAGQAAAELAFKQAEQDLRLAEAATAEQLASAKRAAEEAEQNYAEYMRVEAPYKLKYLAFDRESTDLAEDGTTTEYSELKRMYEADDLLEPTEKLVLRRQKYATERTALDVLRSRLHAEFREKVEIPRERAQREKTLRDARFALDQAETMLPLALKKKQLDFAGLKRNQEKAEKSLADLKADREALTVKAPIDGIVYWGQCVRGQWATVPQIAPRMRPGGPINPFEVFLTIVQPAPVVVHASVPEGALQFLEAGQSAKIIPTGYPKAKVAGKLASLTVAPSSLEPYSATFSIEGKLGPVVPGMACQVVVLSYENAKAIAVPAAAVFAEEKDENARYVYVQGADGKPVKRPVTVGREKEGQIEILKGLAEGEVIQLEKPAEAK